MKKIQLNKTKGQQGLFALVDDEDYEWLNQWNWSRYHNKYSNYANRVVIVNNKDVHIRMHSLILNAKPNQLVDHKDGNGLNNQKSNLRICTRSQNNVNRSNQRNGKSKYLGVSLKKRRPSDKKDYWIAQTNKDGKKIHIGLYYTEIDAAIGYNKKALELHGEFAKLNNINN